jgi:hypothetical protein
MRRAILAALSLVWLATILACTGIGRPLFPLPGEFSIHRTDHGDYQLFHRNGGTIGGHVVGLAFDDRFILLQRDVCVPLRQPHHRLTGVIEFWVVEVGTARRHGPYTEAEFAAARQRLGVPANLVLEPPDDVWARVDPAEARRRAANLWMKRGSVPALIVLLFFTGRSALRRLRRRYHAKQAVAADRRR